MIKKIILTLIIGLFLVGCQASKNKSVTVDEKVSESKTNTTSQASDDDEEDGECIE